MNDFADVAFPMLACAALGLVLLLPGAPVCKGDDWRKGHGWSWARIIIGGANLVYAFALLVRWLSIGE